MSDQQTIVFATDFADCAAEALPTVIGIARAYDATLHLLHATVLHGKERDEYDAALTELEVREKLEMDDDAHDRVVVALRRGIAPAPAILDYAEEAEADLVIVATHGRRGMKRLLLGSVAEEVLRMADRPVLIVRSKPGEGAWEPPRLVLAPLDFSAVSNQGLAAASAWAKRLGAELHLLHVVEHPSVPEFYGPPAVWDLAAATSDVVERTRERLSEIAERLAAEHGVIVTGAARMGYPDREIVEHAKSAGADLIIMPSHGRTGVERFLIGSVTARVARGAPCSVLTLRPESEEANRPGSEAAAATVGEGGDRDRTG